MTPMITVRPGDTILFRYRNHRNEVAPRAAELLAVDFGSNEWYPEPQWFLRCYDLEKRAIRSFAIRNIVGELAEWRIGSRDNARSLAVAEYDAMCGFTMEFAPSPEAHRETYDRIEASIKAAIQIAACGGMVEVPEE